MYQAGGGAGSVAVANSSAVDSGSANVTVKGKGTYDANSVDITAVNQPKAKSYTPAVGGAIIGFTNTNATAQLTGSTNIAIDRGNAFNAPNVNLTATTGKANEIDANAELMSVNAGAVNIVPAPNTALASTAMQTNIIVGDETYNTDTAVRINAVSNLNRYAFAEGDTFGALASGRDKAATSSKDTVNASIGTNGTNTVKGSPSKPPITPCPITKARALRAGRSI